MAVDTRKLQLSILRQIAVVTETHWWLSIQSYIALYWDILVSRAINISIAVSTDTLMAVNTRKIQLSILRDGCRYRDIQMAVDTKTHWWLSIPAKYTSRYRHTDGCRYRHTHRWWSIQTHWWLSILEKYSCWQREMPVYTERHRWLSIPRHRWLSIPRPRYHELSISVDTVLDGSILISWYQELLIYNSCQYQEKYR